jgi:hypothetical protein
MEIASLRNGRLNRVSTPSGSEVDHPRKLRLDPVATALGTDTPFHTPLTFRFLTQQGIAGLFPSVRCADLIPRSALFHEPATTRNRLNRNPKRRRGRRTPNSLSPWERDKG